MSVEVPIIVDELAETTQIDAVQAETLLWERPIPKRPGEVVAVKNYPITGDGVDGDLFVVSHRLGDGSESWADRQWIESGYLREHPGSPLPPLPASVVCVNGLRIRALLRWGPLMRLDYRGQTPNLGLARATTAPLDEKAFADPVLRASLSQILASHVGSSSLAKGHNAWRYLGQLAEEYQQLDYWREVPDMVPAFVDRAEVRLSLAQLSSMPVISSLQYVADYLNREEPQNLSPQPIRWDELEMPDERPVLVDWEINEFTDYVLDGVFQERRVSSFQAAKAGWVAYDWTLRDLGQSSVASEVHIGSEDFLIVDAGDESTIGFVAHPALHTMWGAPVLNRRSPLIQWVIRMTEAARAGAELGSAQLDTLGNLLETPCAIRGFECEKLADFLAAWREEEEEDDGLRPPIGPIGEAAFQPPVYRRR